MRSLAIALALGTAALSLAVPQTAIAEGPPVLQVIVVEVEPADREWYLERVKKVQGIVERLGLSGFRVWRATLAGTSTGALAVVIENPNLAAFAANSTKLQADSEFQKWVKEMQKAGRSKAISNNMWVEVTP